MKRIFTHDASSNQGDEIGQGCVVNWRWFLGTIVFSKLSFRSIHWPTKYSHVWQLNHQFLTIQPYIFGCLKPNFLCNMPIFSWVQPGKASIFGWAPAASYLAARKLPRCFMAPENPDVMCFQLHRLVLGEHPGGFLQRPVATGPLGVGQCQSPKKDRIGFMTIWFDEWFIIWEMMHIPILMNNDE